jgi:hypothetical protein
MSQYRKTAGFMQPMPEEGWQDMREGQSETIGTSLRPADSTETPRKFTSDRSTGVYPNWIKTKLERKAR